jgi:Zn-dependent protease
VNDEVDVPPLERVVTSVEDAAAARDRRAGLGTLVAIAKIGGKILGVLAKLAKAGKVTKVALAGASLWAYASIWSWQFAVLVVASISVHEYGHVWAMQRCGMRTKGFYLVPFVGGAAVPDGEFPSEGALAYVALMGPVFGCVLAGVAALAHEATGAPLFAAVAGWIALVNLFNLLPVNPLDGGRVLRSLAFSVQSVLGTLALAAGMLISIVLALMTHFALFGLLAVIGGIELVVETRARDRMPRMSRDEMYWASVGYLTLIGVLWLVMHAMSHEPGAALALEALQH